MNETAKKMSLRDTIEPKSDQLNYDDMIAGPITVKIVGLKAGSDEQPVIVAIEGRRPYKPCKSMRRVMIAVWGDKGKGWVGQSMTLYGDPSVRFGGGAVGGIRISHVSGITAPVKVLLTVTRSKRVEFVVQPLQSASFPGRAADPVGPVDDLPYDDGKTEGGA